MRFFLAPVFLLLAAVPAASAGTGDAIRRASLEDRRVFDAIVAKNLGKTPVQNVPATPQISTPVPLASALAPSSASPEASARERVIAYAVRALNKGDLARFQKVLTPEAKLKFATPESIAPAQAAFERNSDLRLVSETLAHSVTAKGGGGGMKPVLQLFSEEFRIPGANEHADPLLVIQLLCGVDKTDDSAASSDKEVCLIQDLSVK